MPAETFGILFVCTRNMCRSVLAERLADRELRVRLGGDADAFSVASAGTASWDGLPMHRGTEKVLARLGVRGNGNGNGAGSRCLTAPDVDRADLILTACMDHRDQVVAMRPSASRRTYLLREFARLAGFAPPPGAPPPAAPPPAAPLCLPERARHVVAEAARLRGRVPYTEPGDDDIPDPTASYAAIAACAQVIDQAVRDVLDALCGCHGRLVI
jgi:protein-tyrosine phosphatase